MLLTNARSALLRAGITAHWRTRGNIEHRRVGAAGREHLHGQFSNFPLEQMHIESMEVFRKISDQDLTKKCPTPGGIDVTMWKWLRAMVEHEVHHRGQIYIYLGMLDVKTPPLFGMTSEEVALMAKG